MDSYGAGLSCAHNPLREHVQSDDALPAMSPADLPTADCGDSVKSSSGCLFAFAAEDE